MQSPSPELVITRILDAPRELVWEAWTDPERLTQWWGPKGFTTSTYKVDLRAGGGYFWCIKSPEGRDFGGVGVFQEIVPLEKIVLIENIADAAGNLLPASNYGMSGDGSFQITITFEDREGKTLLTFRDTGIPAGPMFEVTRELWNQSLDKLAENLKAEMNGDVD